MRQKGCYLKHNCHLSILCGTGHTGVILGCTLSVSIKLGLPQMLLPGLLSALQCDKDKDRVTLDSRCDAEAQLMGISGGNFPR